MPSNHALRFLVAAISLAAATLVAAPHPVSTTTGDLVAPPYLSTNQFGVSGVLESVAVPLSGWKVVWAVKDDKDPNPVSGIRVIETNDVVRGARLPVLRLELTRGAYRYWQPVIELAQPFNAETHNILSFIAKVEVPPTLKRVLGDAPPVHTGWFSATFNRHFDDFGVSPFDGNVEWAAMGVPVTMFRYHDFPETRGGDGYTDFAWDMRDGHYSSNKGFVRDRAQSLRLHYDTRKIPEGEKVVISIAQMKLVKGAHILVDDPARYAAWTNFVASYTPDYSDSSAYLKPPATGRIARPIRLTETGKARCEIVVDLSDKINVGNFFPNRDRWLIYLREARGKEKAQARHAAYELRRWMRELTGAEVPVLLTPSAEKNVKLYLGATFAKPHFQKDLDFLASGGAHDGYAIRVRDGNIYIFGASPAGTMYGVYALLENNSDLIWAFRDDEENGTIFTPTPTLDIVWADTVTKPAMAWRGVWAGAWALRNYMNVNSDLGFSVMGGHYLSPQYYYHCEGINRFNPVLDRETGVRLARWSEYNQLSCLSDPEFIEHAIGIVPNIMTMRYNGREHCVIGVDDNYGVCECGLCSAPITNRFGKVLTPQNDYCDFYNAWFYTYLNKLDARIQKLYPGFMTSTFAYFFAAPYPQIELSRNIQPQLCTYVRKSQAQPLFAPVNQHWWKIYQDWAAHGTSLIDYDYWALGFLMYPKAECAKFDVMAKRDIGALSFYAEGDCAGEHLSTANQRWCMARLMWDPDLDVEQLHRAFNRRAYREAAPWMDRFHGTVRYNFFKHANRHLDFEENREVSVMIRDLGLEAELRDYLAKALAAVKHPKSRLQIEKTIADFDHYMQEGQYDWNYPSKRWAKDHPPAPLDAAAASVWSGNRGVRTVDGRRELPLWLARDRGFELKCTLEKPAGTEAVFTFRAPSGSFSFGTPAVEAVAANARTVCDHAWRDLGHGTWSCTVRAGGDAAVQAFAFAYPREGPRWNGGTTLTLTDVQFRTAAGAAPATSAPVFARSPDYQRLLTAMATNNTPAIATLSTNSTVPTVRVLAALEAARRGRPAADLLRPMLGKMNDLGILWGAQLLEPAKKLIAAGDHAGAAAFLREQIALCGLGSDPGSDSEPLRLLAECVLATENLAAVERLLNGQLTGREADPAATFRVYRSIIPVFVKAGEGERALALLDRAFADGRVDLRPRVDFALGQIGGLIAHDKKPVPVARAMQLARRYDGDDRGKALGWSLVARNWQGFMRGLAAAYADKGDFASVSELYNTWAHFDRDLTPIDYTVGRLRHGVDFLRERVGRIQQQGDRAARDSAADAARITKGLGRAKAQLDKDVARWLAALDACTREGSTRDVRFGAQYDLLMHHWDAMPQKERIARIDSFVDDKFISHGGRRRASELVVKLYITPSSTNWTALADHALRCINSGDWSDNARNNNFAREDTDIRLDYILGLADRMLKEQQAPRAKDLLERAAPILGYHAASDKPAADGRQPSAGLLARVKRLDDKMALCGARRPPAAP